MSKRIIIEDLTIDKLPGRPINKNREYQISISLLPSLALVRYNVNMGDYNHYALSVRWCFWKIWIELYKRKKHGNS